MSSAASRLIRFRNNASLQNLIQNNLLRPSAKAVSGASVTRLLNNVSEPQLSTQFNTEKATPYFNILPFQKASLNESEVMKRFSSNGLSGVDRPGIAEIYTRRGRDDLDEDYDDDDDDRIDSHHKWSDTVSGDEGNDEDDFDEDDFDDDDDNDDLDKR